MSGLGTYLAAGAAVAGVSEATGATAFTPVGQQARQQDNGGSGGGSGPVINLPEQANGGVSADALGQLAEAFQQQQPQQSGPSALEVAQLVQSASGNDGAASALSDALEQQQERTEEWRRRWEAAQEGDVDGDGESDVPGGNGEISLPDWLTNQGDGNNDDPAPRSTEPTILDKTERAGNQAEGALRFIGEGANTLGVTVDALGGGDYSTENTYYGRWFDNGGTTRNIDYPDVPSIDLPSKDDFEKPDETLTEKAGNNIRDKLGLSDSDSSSPSRTNDSSTKDVAESIDEPIISLPDSIKQREEDAVRKLQAGNAHQIGGL